MEPDPTDESNIPDVVERYDEYSAQKEDIEYDFTYKKRGIAMIFTFEDYDESTQQNLRKGAINEGNKMKTLMECLGFEAFLLKNKTTEEVQKCIHRASTKDQSHMACIVCIISSHGANRRCYPHIQKSNEVRETKDIIFTKDGHLYLEDFVLPFREDNCPSLRGKPKLFFIQACRGGKLSEKVRDGTEDAENKVEDIGDADGDIIVNMADGLEVTDDGYDMDDEICGHNDKAASNDVHLSGWKPKKYTCLNTPCYRDCLVAYSTMPNYLSFRSDEESMFLRELFEELKRSCNDLDMMEIMERVNLRVTHYSANTEDSDDPNEWKYHGKGEMPWTMSMLTKEVYLRPILIDELQELTWDIMPLL